MLGFRLRTPEERREQLAQSLRAAQTVEESRQAIADALDEKSQQECWGREELVFQPHRRCGCAGPPPDRQCVRCGLGCCPECQPESQGAPCQRCGGPVWAGADPVPTGGVNPHMRGY